MYSRWSLFPGTYRFDTPKCFDKNDKLLISRVVNQNSTRFCDLICLEFFIKNSSSARGDLGEFVEQNSAPFKCRLLYVNQRPVNQPRSKKMLVLANIR